MPFEVNTSSSGFPALGWLTWRRVSVHFERLYSTLKSECCVSLGNMSNVAKVKSVSIYLQSSISCLEVPRAFIMMLGYEWQQSQDRVTEWKFSLLSSARLYSIWMMAGLRREQRGRLPHSLLGSSLALDRPPHTESLWQMSAPDSPSIFIPAFHSWSLIRG